MRAHSIVARYLVHVRTPMAPAEAFAYMADLMNFAEWDPGVDRVEQVEGDGAGPGAAFDVAVKLPGRTMTLRYDTVAFDGASTTMTAFAQNALMTSKDTITVKADGDGSIVTYDAELKLKGPPRSVRPAARADVQADRRPCRGRSRRHTRGRTRRRMNLIGIADALIEAPIVTSFTRLGYEARRRLADWTPLDDYDLSGRVIVITGATSGLGYAAAEQFARCDATLVIVGRTAERNERAVAELTATTGNSLITQVPADMGDLGQVRHLAERVLADHDRLDVLIHNAGALDPERRVAPDGTEATVASQVVGPFLLTSLLLDRLAASAPARVLTMSSGGMYATGLTVSGLEMTPEDYNGTEQYARAKRAQVTLNEMWAERYGDRGITFHALHPGWADTPGVDAGLPTFAKVMGPFLRTPEQGADTLVWLAADDTALAPNGRFWLDRAPRPIHKLPTTKLTDTAQRREQLWNRVADTANTRRVNI